MAQKKIKAAITGSIGSGKSLFSKFIEDEGFSVIKADELGKQLLAEDDKIKQKIIKTFGKEAYKNGKPDTQFLAEKVFSDPVKLQKINSIIHPKVISIIQQMMEEELKKKNKIFVEAALIYEADMEEMFDYIVLITAEESIRMERKRQSVNLSPEDFKKRTENQILDEEKRKRADFIFENNGTEAELKTKANLLLTMLNYPVKKKQ